MKVINKTISRTLLALILLIAGITFKGIGQTNHPYKDKAHYSKVFGKEKPYRIYLPVSYESSVKKYPVIYFFHGWGGRYFKDDNAKLEYEKLGQLADKYQFILVLWDGNMEESEPRPYNIGNHDNIKYDIQMKDYLPELVSFIDTTYRTFTDRNHRGIIGFSMGGILSFYLSGKYPDKFSAAVNMVGSPEFFIGMPDNHTLYQVRYTLDNLKDVSLLFHNRDSCQMSGLNDEVNKGALWSEVKDYEYHKMKGGHKVDDPGETKVFESAVQFIMSRFEHPLPLNKTWSHVDLCPEFSLWDYSVKSDKAEPGYLYLRNVDKNGFGFYTTKWLPEGPELKNCNTRLSTAPVYEPNAAYRISSYSTADRKLTMMHKPADKAGRLHFELPGSGTEIGIAKEEQQAGFAVLDYELNGNRQLIRINEDNRLTLHLLNRDGAFARKGALKVTLSCADSSVAIPSPVQTINLTKGKYLVQTEPFTVTSTKTPPFDGSPWQLRIKVSMEYDTMHLEDALVVPVFYDMPYFSDVKVDDGRLIPSAKPVDNAGVTTKDSIYGTGNGNGKVAPGEQIMLYKDGHRLRLYTDDPYVVASEEKMVDEVLPAVWPDGYTLSSVVKIATDCPEGHEIEFTGHYETKTYMPIYRQLKWGKIKLKVMR